MVSPVSRKADNSLKLGGENRETSCIMVGICYKTWVNAQGRVNALLHSGSFFEKQEFTQTHSATFNM
jgi:hypothetical protein